jgi:hypothetical protein
MRLVGSLGESKQADATIQAIIEKVSSHSSRIGLVSRVVLFVASSMSIPHP